MNHIFKMIIIININNNNINIIKVKKQERRHFFVGWRERGRDIFFFYFFFSSLPSQIHENWTVGFRQG